MCNIIDNIISNILNNTNTNLQAIHDNLKQNNLEDAEFVVCYMNEYKKLAGKYDKRANRLVEFHEQYRKEYPTLLIDQLFFSIKHGFGLVFNQIITEQETDTIEFDFRNIQNLFRDFFHNKGKNNFDYFFFKLLENFENDLSVAIKNILQYDSKIKNNLQNYLNQKLFLKIAEDDYKTAEKLIEFGAQKEKILEDLLSNNTNNNFKVYKGLRKKFKIHKPNNTDYPNFNDTIDNWLKKDTIEEDDIVFLLNEGADRNIVIEELKQIIEELKQITETNKLYKAKEAKFMTILSIVIQFKFNLNLTQDKDKIFKEIKDRIFSNIFNSKNYLEEENNIKILLKSGVDKSPLYNRTNILIEKKHGAEGFFLFIATNFREEGITIQSIQENLHKRRLNIDIRSNLNPLLKRELYKPIDNKKKIIALLELGASKALINDITKDEPGEIQKCLKRYEYIKKIRECMDSQTIEQSLKEIKNLSSNKQDIIDLLKQRVREINIIEQLNIIEQSLKKIENLSDFSCLFKQRKNRNIIEQSLKEIKNLSSNKQDIIDLEREINIIEQSLKEIKNLYINEIIDLCEEILNIDFENFKFFIKELKKQGINLDETKKDEDWNKTLQEYLNSGLEFYCKNLNKLSNNYSIEKRVDREDRERNIDNIKFYLDEGGNKIILSKNNDWNYEILGHIVEKSINNIKIEDNSINKFISFIKEQHLYKIFKYIHDDTITIITNLQDNTINYLLEKYKGI